jgi:CubicO group peptidase (beta-lactamase class C family)
MTVEQLGQPLLPEQLLELALAQGPKGTPGMEQAIYSNTNFLVLAMIVEAETGKSWEDNVAERIAGPLGLEHTYYAGQIDRATNMAGGWMQTEAGWLDTTTVLDPSVGWGVGAMVTTNAELLRFTEALFDDELFESPDTLAQMLRFDTEFDPAYLGEDPPTRIGLVILRVSAAGVRLDGHLGHAAGFNAGALRDPDTGAIIIVTSNDNSAFSGYTAMKVAQYLRDR